MKKSLTLCLSLIFSLIFLFSTGQNNAFDFDGTNDYISVPNASSLIAPNAAMTMSCWVYPTNPAPGFPNFDGFLGFRNDFNADFYLLQLNTTNFEARFRNSSGTNFDVVQGGLVNNTWQHIVMTYDGSLLQVYLNGVPGGSVAANGNITNSALEFVMGKLDFNSPDFFLDGRLDEVGLWSKALSAAEVACMYQRGIDPTDANLELYFDFNEGTAGGNNTSITTVPDRMGNIDGQIVLAALTGTSSNFVNGIASHTRISQSICASSSFSFGGQTLTNSGVYYDVQAVAGACDSIVALTLTVQDTIFGIDNQSACNSFTWIDMNTYTSNNNTAQFTLVGAAAGGCDSVVTLNLTFTSVTSTDTRTECDSLQWIDGNTYTSSNNTANFTYVGGAASGCDSTVTLDLTILSPSNGVDVQNSCNPFTWIDGNTYSSDNNSAVFTISGGNAVGCDSTVTLDLTILNPSTGVDVQTSCDPITWIDGNTYSSDNNSAVFTISGGNAVGCDSTVTLNLTVLSPSNGVDVQTACDSYTWINGVTYTTSNNSATDTLFGGAANGCDSIVKLGLTILGPSLGTDSIEACGPYTWINGVTYSTNNNAATDTLIGGATNGCDSIVTLNLTITSIDTTVVLTLGQQSNLLSAETGASYQWLDCNSGLSAIAGETSIDFTPMLVGSYAVEITKNACIDTSSCVDVLSVGIIDNSFNTELKVYPNPTKDQLSIDLGETYTNLSIQLYSMHGQLIESQFEVESQLINLSLKDQANGVYFIHLTDGESRMLQIRVLKD